MSTQTTPITIRSTIQAPVQTVWELYTLPQHIMQWNQASPDWHCPAASNDLRVGGAFVSTMAAKDGSFQFDFGGIYDAVDLHARIAYHLSDGRTVTVTFEPTKNGTLVVTTFDPESENPLDMQEAGWQAILDSFRQYAESIVNREW